jgi:hypothetical protein
MLPDETPSRCKPGRASLSLPPPSLLPACCSFSARDPTHSFPRSGHGLRRLFRLLAPTLQELCIAHCSDIFHASSFADLAPLQVSEPGVPYPVAGVYRGALLQGCVCSPSSHTCACCSPSAAVLLSLLPPFPAIKQNLETLAVTFMTGRVSAADLAPLEQLRRLRALTLSASRQAEEGGEHCLAGFPDSLLKLKSLTSLAVCSQGAWLHCFAAGCTGAAADAAAAQSHTQTASWPATHPSACLLPPPAGVTNLPVGVTKLKKLESLDVSGCALSFLPSQLWRLAALRHLRLNGTGLLVQLAHTWEPLARLPALESLELRWVPR